MQAYRFNLDEEFLTFNLELAEKEQRGEGSWSLGTTIELGDRDHAQNHRLF